MDIRVILLLTLGLAGTIANSTQQTNSNVKPLSERSESETKQNEETSPNNGEQEQKKVTNLLETTAITADEDSLTHAGGSIDILLQETFSPDNLLAQSDISFDDLPDTPIMDNILYRTALANKVQDEIMETAEGFVPIPIFRKRQKARRRFATRRNFLRNPYRRNPYFFYPYYGYYHPSSLRFY